MKCEIFRHDTRDGICHKTWESLGSLGVWAAARKGGDGNEIMFISEESEKFEIMKRKLESEMLMQCMFGYQDRLIEAQVSRKYS